MRAKVLKILICILLVFPLTTCGNAKMSRKVSGVSGGGFILTLHTFDGSYGALPLVPNFGHSFLSVENRSGGAATVGKYALEDGQSVSVSVWGQSAHIGVWYNLESIYYDAGKYDTCRTVSKEIGLEQLAVLGGHIRDRDSWSFFYNCSAWSIGGWNAVSDGDGIDIFGLPTPTALKKKINEFENCSGAARVIDYGAAGYFEGESFIEFKPAGGL
jgi:hypothetical protein